MLKGSGRGLFCRDRTRDKTVKLEEREGEVFFLLHLLHVRKAKRKNIALLLFGEGAVGSFFFPRQVLGHKREGLGWKRRNSRMHWRG